MKRLEGKVAVITGGARGLGQAMAELFAHEGAKVIAADMGDMAYSAENVEGYTLNVTDTVGCKKFFDEIVEKYGKIDILVNNAGITRDSMTRKMTDEQWDLVIDVNLKGVFNLTRYVGPHMQANGGGSIINISSVVGIYGNFGQTNYAATKFGVIGMTKSMAKELGRKNINVNAVAPGFIATEMTQKMPEKVLTMMAEKAPLNRIGAPIDIANACLYLASEEASFVTGTTLSVDGGIVL